MWGVKKGKGCVGWEHGGVGKGGGRHLSAENLKKLKFVRGEGGKVKVHQRGN